MGGRGTGEGGGFKPPLVMALRAACSRFGEEQHFEICVYNTSAMRVAKSNVIAAVLVILTFARLCYQTQAFLNGLKSESDLYIYNQYI